MTAPGLERRRIVAKAVGRVQAVGYRAFTADEAVALNIDGYVKNLPDGRTVEIVAEGDEPTLRIFVERLREGPPLAVVDDLTFRWEDPTGEFVGFESVI